MAWHYYGDALAYERIIVANPHVAIYPVLPSGIQLIIPVISVNKTLSEIPPWLR
ncbi:tail protein X [Escherichia coli]|uniref:tail protein X n=1 Tax=Escherichia coli TaxID=562 RepID=UPI00202CBC55|nr:tail protein X [Escherichia coli]